MFRSELGLEQEDWEQRDQLLAGVRTGAATPKGVTPLGDEKYEVVVNVTGPNGQTAAPRHIDQIEGVSLVIDDLDRSPVLAVCVDDCGKRARRPRLLAGVIVPAPPGSPAPRHEAA